MKLFSLVIAAMLLRGAADLQQDTAHGTDRAAIVQAALDYAEGYYGGEPMRMTRAVSPFVSKRGLTVRQGIPPFLVQMNADMLIDAANGVKLAAPDRHIAIEVLDVTGEIASAARVHRSVQRLPAPCESERHLADPERALARADGGQWCG
jgi:hypothetical protein